MVTPTIILFEKFRESVLVPEIKSLERKFKLDRYYLRDLIEETKKNKRKANYDDCRFEVIHQDSTPSNDPPNLANFSEANNQKVEGREESKNISGKEEEKESSQIDKANAKIEPEPAPLGEDDWVCDYCQQINKMSYSDCSRWRKTNEIIEDLIREKRYTERYSKKWHKWDEIYDSYTNISWPKCKKKSYSLY